MTGKCPRCNCEFTTAGCQCPVIRWVSSDVNAGMQARELARLRQAVSEAKKLLEWLQVGFGGMWGSPEKIWYDEALETAPPKLEDWLSRHGGGNE